MSIVVFVQGFRRAVHNPARHPSPAARDKRQPYSDDGPGGSLGALTGRRETFDGEGYHHDSPGAVVSYLLLWRRISAPFKNGSAVSTNLGDMAIS